MIENIKGLKLVDEIWRNPVKKVKEFKEKKGRKVVGYLCAYPPAEILSAADVIPYKVFGNVDQPVTEGNKVLAPIICSYVRSIVDLSMKGKFDFLDGIIWCHSCDCMHKGGFVFTSIVGKPIPYIIEIPTTEHEGTIGIFKYELEQFKKWLENLMGKEISSGKLKKAIQHHNQRRSLVRGLYKLRQQDPPLISSVEVLKVISVIESVPVEEGNRLLREVMEDIKERKDGPKKQSARLLIWGSIIDSTSLLEMFENAGANVVMDDTCICSRPYWLHSEKPLVEVTGNLIENIAESYLSETKCPRTYRESYRDSRKDYKSDLEERFGYLKDYIDQWKVNGVVVYSLRNCDIHGFEVVQVRDYLDMLGIPSIYIEPEYDAKSLPPLRTRIQAFIETIS